MRTRDKIRIGKAFVGGEHVVNLLCNNKCVKNFKAVGDCIRYYYSIRHTLK